MLLHLARHAWAGHFGDPGWPDDSLRELTPEGVQRYHQVVTALAERDFRPQQIATSGYARCRQTADIIAHHTGGQITELDCLTPGVDLLQLIEWTLKQSDEQLCWVGHNPDMPLLASFLLGDERAQIRFAKGAVCCLRIEDPPADPRGWRGAAGLEWHTTAKLLGV